MDLFTVENGIALLTLTALEIVLGIDNIVFIAIQASKLPPAQQARARNVGLLLAMGMRILLLLGISWVIGLKETLFTIPWPGTEAGHGFSGRDLVLLIGGLFLVAKATHEIHAKVLHQHEHERKDGGHAKFGAVIAQITILDIVFSLDSVITAVGMVKSIAVMITAVILAVVVMLIFAGAISRFVEKNPTIKMLALSFLLLIGFVLIIEGWGEHVAKGYIYFAMGFSLAVELLNLRVIQKHVIPAAAASEEDPGDV